MAAITKQTDVDAQAVEGGILILHAGGRAIGHEQGFGIDKHRVAKGVVARIGGNAAATEGHGDGGIGAVEILDQVLARATGQGVVARDAGHAIFVFLGIGDRNHATGVGSLDVDELVVAGPVADDDGTVIVPAAVTDIGAAWMIDGMLSARGGVAEGVVAHTTMAHGEALAHVFRHDVLEHVVLGHQATAAVALIGVVLDRVSVAPMPTAVEWANGVCARCNRD